MTRLNEYNIPFSGLGIGNHWFEFEVEDSFFDNFEHSEIHSARIHVTINMERKERMLVFDFQFKGSIHTPCDRCTDDFDLGIEGSENLVVKFGHEHSDVNDEVIIIPDTEHQVNVAPYIYEFILLTLPIKIVHPDDENGKSTCNPDMLRRIEELSPHETFDPRWEALKKTQKKDDN